MSATRAMVPRSRRRPLRGLLLALGLVLLQGRGALAGARGGNLQGSIGKDKDKGGAGGGDNGKGLFGTDSSGNSALGGPGVSNAPSAVKPAVPDTPMEPPLVKEPPPPVPPLVEPHPVEPPAAPPAPTHVPPPQPSRSSRNNPSPPAPHPTPPPAPKPPSPPAPVPPAPPLPATTSMAGGRGNNWIYGTKPVGTPLIPSPPTPAPTPVWTPPPTPAPTPVQAPPKPTIERKKEMYEADSKQGTIYMSTPPGDDAPADPDSLTGGEGGGRVRISPAGNINPAGGGGQFNDGHSGPRTGAPNVGGADRVAFVGYKRISALNTDFNLPINPFDRFGSAIANLGDLDGDEATVEIAVGAPGDDTYVNDAGAVYIISLDKWTSIQNYRKIIPGEGMLQDEVMLNGAFGSALAPLGDFNGDGIMDLVVGAPYKDLTGAIYILYLTHGGQVKDWGKISGVFGGFNAPLTVGDEFGCSIANIGDLDKDGVPDLAVGACGDDDLKYGEFVKQGAAGAVYILFMKWDGTVKNYKKISARSGNLITGPKDGDRFGASIAFLGDLNKDGHPEIAVGAPMSDIYTGLLSSDMGSVYQLELLPSGDVKRFQIISPAYVPVDPRYSAYVYFSAPLMAYDYFGAAVGAIDVDKDGLYDLVVGSRGYDNVYSDLGNVYVLYLDWSGNLWTWEDVSATGLRLPIQRGEQFGAAIAFINDMFTSLLVGAPGEPLGSQGGSVYALRAVPM